MGPSLGIPRVRINSCNVKCTVATGAFGEWHGFYDIASFWNKPSPAHWSVGCQECPQLGPAAPTKSRHSATRPFRPDWQSRVGTIRNLIGFESRNAESIHFAWPAESDEAKWSFGWNQTCKRRIRSRPNDPQVVFADKGPEIQRFWSRRGNRRRCRNGLHFTALSSGFKPILYCGTEYARAYVSCRDGCDSGVCGSKTGAIEVIPNDGLGSHDFV